MKKMKIVLSLTLAALLCLALAGCGSSPAQPQTSQLTQQQLEEAIQKSVENMNAVKNLRANGNMDMSFVMLGSEMTSTTTFTSEAYSAPFGMHMDLTLDNGEMGSTQTEMYMQQEGDLLKTYTKMSEGDWYVDEMDATTFNQSMQQYDAQGSVAAYIKYAQNFQLVGSETLDGVDTWKIEGVVTAANIQDMLKETGMDTALSSLTGDDLVSGSTSQLFEGAGDMPLTLWVQKDALYPVRCDVDMTAMLQGVMSNMMGMLDDSQVDDVTPTDAAATPTTPAAATPTAGEATSSTATDALFTVKAYTISLTMSDFDKLPAFSIPQEVLDAPTLDALMQEQSASPAATQTDGAQPTAQ